MAIYSTTLTVGVDTALETYEAEPGHIVGWKTSAGAILRPRIVFEIELPNGTQKDLDEAETAAQGISYDYADGPGIEKTEDDFDEEEVASIS